MHDNDTQITLWAAGFRAVLGTLLTVTDGDVGRLPHHQVRLRIVDTHHLLSAGHRTRHPRVTEHVTRGLQNTSPRGQQLGVIYSCDISALFISQKRTDEPQEQHRLK